MERLAADPAALRATRHVYVHVPFCARKCAYCALYSEADLGAEAAAAFPGALAAELDAFNAAAGAMLRPLSVYVGGGTPTALGASLPALLGALRARLDLSRIEEWTVEARPDTVTPEVAAVLAAHGVNRVSMGVQSTDPGVLRAIGREQPPDCVRAAFAALRGAGVGNIGVDLITGLPGAESRQTLRDIERVAALGPDHASVYSLAVEPGTPLAAGITARRFSAPSDDSLMDGIADAARALLALGFNRYEISNYSRPGRECRYNLAVWRGEDYLGLGPSASSRVGRARWTNAPDARGYLEAAKNGAPFPGESEIQSPEDDAEGRFLFGLRLSEGVDPGAFAAAHPAALALAPRWEAGLEAARRVGLAERGGKKWRLTPRGREVADSVMEMVCS